MLYRMETNAHNPETITHPSPEDFVGLCQHVQGLITFSRTNGTDLQKMTSFRIKGKGPILEKLTQFNQLVEQLHKILRIDLTASLPKLDEKKLPEETQREINALKDSIAAHKNATTDDQQDTINENATKILAQLKSGILGDSDASIPILLGDKSTNVSNSDQLGLYLLAFQLAMKGILNTPEVLIKELFNNQIGGAISIIYNQEQRFAHHDSIEMTEYYEGVCDKFYKALTTVLKKPENIRAMQIASMTSDAEIMIVPYIPQLLDYLKLPEYPTHIETEEEYKTLLKYISQQTSGFPFDALFAKDPTITLKRARQENPSLQEHTALVQDYIQKHGVPIQESVVERGS